MNKKQLFVFMCPTLSDYKKPPKKELDSELFDCPKCNKKMWLSKKKKKALLFAALLNQDIMLGCYYCIKKQTEGEPVLFKNSWQTGIA